MNTHEQLITQILRELLHIDEKSVIHSSTELRTDLGLDSMSSLIFLMQLEDKINGFTIDPESLDMDDLLTVSSVNEYILREQKKAQKTEVCYE